MKKCRVHPRRDGDWEVEVGSEVSFNVRITRFSYKAPFSAAALVLARCRYSFFFIAHFYAVKYLYATNFEGLRIPG
jgi:hypothetical protein